MEVQVSRTIQKIKKYMNSNRLALNCEKTKIIIISKDREVRENFSVTIDNKEIRHSKSVMILGSTLDENLQWDHHVSNTLIPNLKNRLRTLKLTLKYMNPKFCQQYAGAIFRGKLLFGIETWAGAKQSLVDKVQSLQDRAAKLVLQGTVNNEKLSNLQRHKILGWLSIQQEATHGIVRMVHKVTNQEIPACIAELMPLNKISLRIQIHRKLAAKPRVLNSTALYRSTF